MPIRARSTSHWLPPRPTSGSARRKASWRSRRRCVYLAVAPKSNAVYAAYNAARAFIAGDGSRPVPLRLRNAPTRLMKDLGYGKGYRYAHDEPDAYAAGEHYLPDGHGAAAFLCADERGLEARIRERLAELRERDAERDKTIVSVRAARQAR